MAVQIKESNSSNPMRILIYGTPGIGKSTLGAKSDSPIFISPEGGNDQLKDSNGNPVKEFTGIKVWKDLIEALTLLKNTTHQFKTVVIDSADWVEKLCHAEILANPMKPGKSIITVDGGYNAGYRRSEAMHRELIELISSIRDTRGMNVITTAHAQVKQVKDPSMPEDYDQFCIKCHDMVSSLWQEWSDALIFARFRTFVKTSEDDKARAIGDGTRVAYTIAQPSFQAKNRYGLKPEMEFTESFWSQLKAHVYGKSATEISKFSIADAKSEIEGMFINVTDEKMQATIRKAAEDAGDDEIKIKAISKRMKDLGYGKTT